MFTALSNRVLDCDNAKNKVPAAIMQVMCTTKYINGEIMNSLVRGFPIKGYTGSVSYTNTERSCKNLSSHVQTLQG